MIRIVYTDWVWRLDPEAMAESAGWLHEYTGDLFDGRLPWCDGARDCWKPLRRGDSDGVGDEYPRGSHRRALNSIGRQYFSATVCGDEVRAGQTRPGPLSTGGPLLDL